ncbi:hypothetical protein HanRHA438_Chr08g0345881 [Helianthus annuus]|nr:hypothetical protein HanRHA438_Chr08g0345881 [Helianthus annuus]
MLKSDDADYKRYTTRVMMIGDDGAVRGIMVDGDEPMIRWRLWSSSNRGVGCR